MSLSTLHSTFSTSPAVTWRNGEREPLWPEGKMPDAQPHLIAEMTDVADAPGFDPDAHRMPYLEWFAPPSKPNGICMLLISGGGYNNCCDVGLVRDWRDKFTALGCQCVSLVYRTPRPKGLPFYSVAWEDGQRAVRIVRSQAAKRGFRPDRIGTMSMSAGSHLATLLATSSLTPAYAPVDKLDETVSCETNWAITGSIVYGLSDGIGTPNSRQGDAVDVTIDDAFKFDANTPPMCMLHGGVDPYSPFNSTKVYRRLKSMGIPAELHLFADRQHGFWGDRGECEEATAYDAWFGRVREFMTQLGLLGPLAEEVPLMSRYADDGARGAYLKEPVWPEGKMPDPQPEQCVPYIEWHIPKELKTKAVQIVYAGGAYDWNKPDDYEVAPFRRYLNAKGMAVVTLKYRTPRPQPPLEQHTTAWQDLQRTIRIVKSKAAGLGFDPDRIGIMGSSAGGHLTLLEATSSRHRCYNPIDELDAIPCNVQWAVVVYPAYVFAGHTMETTAPDGGELPLAPEFSFDPLTPPMVFIHGGEDVWSSVGSVRCWEHLARMGIQCDLHTLATRPHCFQRVASPGTGSYTWMDRIWEFMNHKGFNK